MNWKLALPAALMFLISLFVSCYSTKQLRKKHSGDIRIVWYFFSLSWVATFGITWWAVSIGALNQHGFVGDLGKSLKWLLEFMLDLNTDLIVLLAIVSLITLPQLGCYVLSGLSGCATTPFLIEGSLSFLIWGLVKSFALCGGIIFSLATFGMWHDWHTWLEGGFAMTYTSTMLVMFSFAVLLMYRETETIASDFQKHFPNLSSPFRAIHKWCTRHSHPG